MKSVLISIQPKWVEKICHEIGNENGKPIYEKVVEVRKSRPKLETPFKCYIYCTQTRKTDDAWTDGMILGFDSYKRIRFCNYCDKEETFNGKVIGEFVCDEIVSLWAGYADERGACCLSYDEMENYLGFEENGITNKMGYGWHISDLKIYDKPKDLSKFWTIKCTNKRNGCIGCEVKPNCIKTITKPPQSWCYVESLGE